MKKITYILITLISFSFAAVAQSGNESSRLNVGTNSKLPNVNSNLNGYLVRSVRNEVSVSKEAALADFYRKLLISKPKNTKPTPKVVFNNKEMLDYLFSNEKVVVSNVYPNPANDYAYIDFKLKDKSAKASISFHNLVGAQLTAVSLDGFDEKITVPTRSWDNGIYFYQLVVDGKKVATKKLLVRHN